MHNLSKHEISDLADESLSILTLCGVDPYIVAAKKLSFEEGFKKAMELLQPPATKPLSEITNQELSELAKIAKITIGNDYFDLYRSLSEFRNSILSNPCWPVDFFDFLRSKGYILPTYKG